MFELLSHVVNDLSGCAGFRRLRSKGVATFMDGMHEDSADVHSVERLKLIQEGVICKVNADEIFEPLVMLGMCSSFNSC